MNHAPQRHSYWLMLALCVSFLPAGCLFFGHKKTAAPSTSTNAAPDKILYDRAVSDYQHGRYTEARLNLQALINTYPESEYLAKAKLAVADSYYKEGGIDGLTQAVQEYKDFITFFPFLPEAAYAQMQVAMSHYRMMEKADRDPTQARLAEVEFQDFLLKYPKSSLVPEAQQRLRDVQEVIAQGDFDIAQFYFVKGDYRAAGARLVQVTDRYPLFSSADQAIWMIGDIYRRAARGTKNEQERARWRALSDVEFTRLLKEYPLSPLAKQAKALLAQDGIKPPKPDPAALAMAKKEEKYSRKHESLLEHAEGMLRSSPDVSRAAHFGEPDLNPPGQSETTEAAFEPPATTTNTGSSAGQNLNVQATAAGSDASTASGSSSTAESVDPNSGAAATNSSSSAAGTDGTSDSAAPPPATSAVPPPDASATPPATGTDVASPNTTTEASKPESKKLNKKKESTSKKKHGLRKLIPW